MNKTELLQNIYNQAFDEEVEKNAGWMGAAWKGVSGLAKGLGGAAKSFGQSFGKDLGDKTRGKMLRQAGEQFKSTIKAHPVTAGVVGGVGALGTGAGAISAIRGPKEKY
jgi:hypothetical protein